MKALDTNIIVRFLVADDKIQTEQVFKIFKISEKDKKPLFISLLVILETLWVLESVYNISRLNIIEAIKNMIRLPFLKFEQLNTLQQFIRNSEKYDYDLSDLLIAHVAASNKCQSVLTFDKKAARSELFELVEY